MSQKSMPQRVVEWSAQGVRVADGPGVPPRTYATAAQAAAAGGGRVVLAPSRRSVFFRTMALPNAARADVRRLLDVQAAQVFPIPPSELAFDFQATDEMTPEGRTHLVVAMPAGELKRAFDDLQSAGFTIERVVPTALGAALSAQAAGLSDAVLVERTPEGLALDVVAGGVLRASRIALPDADVAEEARRTASMAGYQGLPVLLVGGAGDGRGAESPLSILGGPAASGVVVDLEPREIVLKREEAGRNRRRRFAALMAIAALAFAGLVWADRNDAQRAVDRERGKMNASVNRLKNLQKAIEADAQKAATNEQTLVQAFQPGQRMSDVVAHATQLVPEGLWLTGISVERGKPLLLRGTATRSEVVADYLDRLGKSDRLRDVRLVFSNNADIGNVPVVQFSITAFPVGNIPLADPRNRRRT